MTDFRKNSAVISLLLRLCLATLLVCVCVCVTPTEHALVFSAAKIF